MICHLHKQVNSRDFSLVCLVFDCSNDLIVRHDRSENSMSLIIIYTDNTHPGHSYQPQTHSRPSQLHQ
jgi:hypothetical protein